MTVKKPIKKTEPDVSTTEIDRVINAGSPPPGNEVENTAQKEVKFQMVISANFCQLIDGDRELTKISRRSWLLQAAKEKLEREGKL
jgi:hypothetical protein